MRQSLTMARLGKDPVITVNIGPCCLSDSCLRLTASGDQKQSPLASQCSNQSTDSHLTLLCKNNRTEWSQVTWLFDSRSWSWLGRGAGLRRCCSAIGIFRIIPYSSFKDSFFEKVLISLILQRWPLLVSQKTGKVIASRSAVICCFFTDLPECDKPGKF